MYFLQVGRVVSLHELEMCLEIEQKHIIETLDRMKEKYKMQDRGIEIVKVNNGFTLSSKKEYHEYIYTIIDKRVKPSLSQAALEVLAIIAYNPKITRAEIETIRGVNSDASMYRLLEHNLIEEAGKLELPGKPMSYTITEEFLKKFGLNTIEDLPELPKYKMNENRQIVEDIESITDKEKEEEGEDNDRSDKREDET